MDSLRMVPHNIEDAERFFLRFCETILLSNEDDRIRIYLDTHPESKVETVNGYVLPRCKQNEWIYQREKWFHDQYVKKKRAYFQEQGIQGEVYSPRLEDMPEILFFFDPCVGQISAQHGGTDVANLLTVYMGVTQEQIQETPYLYASYRKALQEIQRDTNLWDLFQKYKEEENNESD